MPLLALQRVQTSIHDCLTLGIALLAPAHAASGSRQHARDLIFELAPGFRIFELHLELYQSLGWLHNRLLDEGPVA